jgi:hypothetical protein
MFDHTPAITPTRKKFLVPMKSQYGGTQSPFDRYEEGLNILLLPKMETRFLGSNKI